MQRRRSAILILSAALVVAGAIFVGQGLGVLQGRSFMVGDRSWAVIGAWLVVLGAGIARWELQRR
jgi:F0F1-type ATP synthase assembly protein I